MLQYNSYIKDELLKIPFDLFNIISDYLDLNKNVKVAFVGGYLRDLLISKIHNRKYLYSNDLDIVIEGSAITLARFIKKKISNIELCLIKEFELYNTVEININDIKIDIASARQETYLGPGLNPIVKDSTILEDLKRRDFSINAIAYEISKREIYDFFQGINHIKNKELHLLHDKSIEDDPSRLLRCAKYASRLGFKISKESLYQSKKVINKWPWKYKKTNSEIKFPPGISIRLRMEITEIIKYDNLPEVISELNKWGVLSLLNSNIEVNKNFKRGLKCIKKLKGKEILYLLKDSKSLEIISKRFYLNTKEKKILDDYLDTKELLELNHKEYLTFSPSDWTKFIEHSFLDKETVKLLICSGIEFWKPFLKWLLIYRFVKSKKTGEELKKEGWLPGKEMGDEIERLRYLEIDNI